MRAAWYERQGPASDVLVVGTMPDPEPGPGEVRVRLYASGVNPDDVKKRRGWLGCPMSHPRVIPHSDGAGVIDAVGDGVPAARAGERVWVYRAQSRRAFGTAAELTVVPSGLAVPLPEGVPFEVGACVGVPGITAHQAVFGDGPVHGLLVLVSGAAGAVGSLATSLATDGAAEVIALVRTREQATIARLAGARHVVMRGARAADTIRAIAPQGVARIVEVSLSENAALAGKVLAQGGTIAAYGSADDDGTTLPFWPLLFANATVRLLGSDDFPPHAVQRAVAELGALLASGLIAPPVGLRVPLEDIAAAHEAVERRSVRGRVVVEMAEEPPRSPPAAGRVAPLL